MKPPTPPPSPYRAAWNLSIIGRLGDINRTVTITRRALKAIEMQEFPPQRNSMMANCNQIERYPSVWTMTATTTRIPPSPPSRARLINVDWSVDPNTDYSWLLNEEKKNLFKTPSATHNNIKQPRCVYPRYSRLAH